jgi:hypothetical protein
VRSFGMRYTQGIREYGQAVSEVTEMSSISGWKIGLLIAAEYEVNRRARTVHPSNSLSAVGSKANRKSRKLIQRKPLSVGTLRVSAKGMDQGASYVQCAIT